MLHIIAQYSSGIRKTHTSLFLAIFNDGMILYLASMYSKKHSPAGTVKWPSPLAGVSGPPAHQAGKPQVLDNLLVFQTHTSHSPASLAC